MINSNIAREQKIESSLIIDPDYINDTYVYDLIDENEMSKIKITSWFNNILNKNMTKLQQDQEILDVNESRKYHYMPDKLSYEKYNSTSLYYILIYVNQCYGFFDFTPETIIVPKLQNIYDIISQNDGETNVIPTGITLKAKEPNILEFL